MLDVELIENLYNGLDKEQKERLMELVFKKSKDDECFPVLSETS